MAEAEKQHEVVSCAGFVRQFEYLTNLVFSQVRGHSVSKLVIFCLYSRDVKVNSASAFLEAVAFPLVAVNGFTLSINYAGVVGGSSKVSAEYTQNFGIFRAAFTTSGI